MSKSDEMDNLIVDLINKFDATYQNIMDELPIKLKDPFLKVTFSCQIDVRGQVRPSFYPCIWYTRDRSVKVRR